MKLKGKKVAIFGLGDQIRYPENFADGIGLLAEVFEGMRLLGRFYFFRGLHFRTFQALRGEQWCGWLSIWIISPNRRKRKSKHGANRSKKSSRNSFVSLYKIVTLSDANSDGICYG